MSPRRAAAAAAAVAATAAAVFGAAAAGSTLPLAQGLSPAANDRHKLFRKRLSAVEAATKSAAALLSPDNAAAAHNGAAAEVAAADAGDAQGSQDASHAARRRKLDLSLPPLDSWSAADGAAASASTPVAAAAAATSSSHRHENRARVADSEGAMSFLTEDVFPQPPPPAFAQDLWSATSPKPPPPPHATAMPTPPPVTAPTEPAVEKDFKTLFKEAKMSSKTRALLEKRQRPPSMVRGQSGAHPSPPRRRTPCPACCVEATPPTACAPVTQDARCACSSSPAIPAAHGTSRSYLDHNPPAGRRTVPLAAPALL